MNTIGNILWILLGGLISAIVLFIEGIVCCISLIGTPVGLQLFKMAGFVLLPFGKKVVSVKPSGFKNVVNILWLLLLGWESTLAYLVTGLIFCITIIGIPFGKQYFKLAQFIALPLGHDFSN
ncbi:MAG: YccF domain-containing protein [Bacilli bacterium]